MLEQYNHHLVLGGLLQAILTMLSSNLVICCYVWKCTHDLKD